MNNIFFELCFMLWYLNTYEILLNYYKLCSFSRLSLDQKIKVDIIRQQKLIISKKFTMFRIYNQAQVYHYFLFSHDPRTIQWAPQSLESNLIPSFPAILTTVLHQQVPQQSLLKCPTSLTDSAVPALHHPKFRMLSLSVSRCYKVITFLFPTKFCTAQQPYTQGSSSPNSHLSTCYIIMFLLILRTST